MDNEKAKEKQEALQTQGIDVNNPIALLQAPTATEEENTENTKNTDDTYTRKVTEETTAETEKAAVPEEPIPYSSEPMEPDYQTVEEALAAMAGDAAPEAYAGVRDMPESSTPVKPAEELTAEDFANPTLYTAMMRMTALECKAYEIKARAKAESLGKEVLRNYKEMLQATKADEASKKKKERDAAKARREAKGREVCGPGKTEYLTLPEGYHNVEITCDFVAGDSEICVVKEDRKGEASLIPISYTPALITHFVDDNKRVEVLHRRRNRWITDIIPMYMLQTPSEIKHLVRLYGFKIAARQYPDVADFFTAMIDKNECSLKTIPAQPGLGWDKRLKRFVFGPGPGYALAISEGMAEMLEGLQPAGSYDVWLEATRKLRALGVLSFQYALAASFSGPLVALEGKGSTCPVINIWGKPGTGKSFGSKVGMTVWGSIDTMEMSLKMSAPGKEAQLGFQRNITAFMEDSNNMTEKERANLPSLIYDLANGTGTKKAKVGDDGEIGLRAMKRWQTSIIITSEQPVNEQAMIKYSGGEARLSLVPGPLKPYLSRTEFKRLDKEVYSRHYGWVGRAYIKEVERLRSTRDPKNPSRTLYDVLSARADEEIDAAVQASGKEVNPRVASTAALIYLADLISDEYIFKDGKHLQPTDYVNCMRDERETDQNARIIETLTSAAINNKFKFTDSATDKDDGRWGIIKNNVAWYNTKTFKRIVREGGGACALVLQALIEKNMLVTKPGKDPTKPVVFRISGTSVDRGYGIILPDLGSAIDDSVQLPPSKKIRTMPGDPKDPGWARGDGYKGAITSWEEIKKQQTQQRQA